VNLDKTQFFLISIGLIGIVIIIYSGLQSLNFPTEKGILGLGGMVLFIISFGTLTYDWKTKHSNVGETKIV
jgi:hypothetical protein